jgi:hypothetical protein
MTYYQYITSSKLASVYSLPDDQNLTELQHVQFASK